MAMITYEREDLYDRVWSKPISALAVEEGLSGRGLAKICEKLHVPRPPRGYWAKVQAGKKPKKTKLPKWKPGIPKVHRRYVSDVESEETISAEARMLLSAAKGLDRLMVPDTLDEPHPVLQKSLKRLRAKKPRSLRRTTRLSIPVRTAEVRERSIVIIDALLKALDRLEIPVEVTKPERDGETVTCPSKTIAKLLGAVVEFGIEEQTESVKTLHESEFSRLLGSGPSSRYHREPTGQLALKIYTSGHKSLRKTWADGKKQRVEDCLNSFIIGLVRVAEAVRDWEEERERARQEEKVRRRQRQEAEHRAGHERNLREDLESRLIAFEKAQSSRRFAESLELQEHGDAGRRAAWLRWAEGVAEELESKALNTELPSPTPPPFDENKFYYRYW